MKTAKELNKLPPIGEVRLLDEDGNVIEKSPIREGRFSVTPKEDFFLLNFSISSGWWTEEIWDEKKILYVNGYPSLEILTKVSEMSDSYKIKIPLSKDVWHEWDVNYNTNYYDGTHVHFDYAELTIRRLENDLFFIEFSGKPIGGRDQDKVVGECELPLSETLKRRW